MAEPHAHSQPIQTYGPAPHNRNIWPHNSRATAAPSRLADSFVCAGGCGLPTTFLGPTGCFLGSHWCFLGPHGCFLGPHGCFLVLMWVSRSSWVSYWFSLVSPRSSWTLPNSSWVFPWSLWVTRSSWVFPWSSWESSTMYVSKEGRGLASCRQGEGVKDLADVLKLVHFRIIPVAYVLRMLSMIDA